MTQWLNVLEFHDGRWRVLCHTRSEAEAIRIARMRWGVYCRPVCIKPDIVSVDAAFPEGARRVAFESVEARYAAFTRARRAA